MTNSQLSSHTESAVSRPGLVSTFSDGPVAGSDFLGGVDTTLTEFLEQKLAEMPCLAGELVAEIRSVLLSGGKRLRPLFCHLGWRAAGGEPADAGVLRAASGLELFHVAALIHDDIMDRSDLRHGVATVHRQLARLWNDPARPEHSEWFGVCSAIVAGDLCWAWSEEMFRTCGLSEQALYRAGAYLATMRTEVMAGQYLDLHPPLDRYGDWLDYAQQINLYKTARYTVARPLQIGAALAGAPAGLLSAFQAFGERLGSAFQLRDDLLGVFGDPARTGKSNEDDLREGKRTLLIATALRDADNAQAAIIDTYLGNAHSRDEFERLRVAISATGAPERIQNAIIESSREAIDALREVALTASLRETLVGLATSLTERVT